MDLKGQSFLGKCQKHVKGFFGGGGGGGGGSEPFFVGFLYVKLQPCI